MNSEKINGGFWLESIAQYADGSDKKADKIEMEFDNLHGFQIATAECRKRNIKYIEGLHTLRYGTKTLDNGREIIDSTNSEILTWRLNIPINPEEKVPYKADGRKNLFLD